MSRPRHTRHGGESGRPRRSRSKLRVARFGEGAGRKRTKGARRRFAHGGPHGPGKKRKKRRKLKKKRRVLRYTIRYDRPKQTRRRSRTAVRVLRRRGGVVSHATGPSPAPEVAAIAAAFRARTQHPVASRVPVAPRALVARPLRVIVPKPPADFAARVVRQVTSQTAR